MPNGGPNCSYCVFNQAVRDFAERYFREKEELLAAGNFEAVRKLKERAEIARMDHAREHSYCLVHKIRIDIPLWTVCGHGTDMAGYDAPIPEAKYPPESTGSHH